MAKIQRFLQTWYVPLFVLLILLGMLFSGFSGAVHIELGMMPQLLKFPFVHDGLDEQSHFLASVFWNIRLPRIVMSAFVGAVLAISGASLQTLFRNPLAEPGLIGISSGAALAASLVLVNINLIAPIAETATWQMWLLPLSTFLGALLTSYIAYSFASKGGVTQVATLLLVGIAVTALSEAIIQWMISWVDDETLRDITFWRMGSFGGITWRHVGITLPFYMITIAGLPRLSASLNAMLMGDSQAFHLGVSVQWVKAWVLIAVALGVGASVSVSGVIGFVGLVIPHVVRLLLGPDNTFVLPASALLGAALLVYADWLARTIVSPVELPIGVVTALIGAPFFMWLLYKLKSS